MLSSFFSYLGPTAKIRRKDIENPESLIPRIKYVYVVPPWLENCCRKFDDYPIQWIQQRLSNMSFVLLRLLKVFWLFWSGMSAPLVTYLLGYDHVAMLWLCHMIMLLVTMVTLKRFIWRYRPFMVARAKCLTGSLSSSFPSRSFACLTTYCFLAYKTTTVLITANKATQPANTDELGPFTGLIPILFVGFGMGLSALAGWSELLTGSHYPTDCIGGFITGLFVVWTGGMLHGRLQSSYCSVEEMYTSSEDTSIPHDWPYATMEWMTVAKWALIGCLLITIFGRKAVLNWGRIYHCVGLLLPVAMALLGMSCDASSREQRIPQSVPSSAGYVFAAIATVFVIHMIVKHCMCRPSSWVAHVMAFAAVFSLSTVAICFWRTLLPEGEEEGPKEDLIDSTVAMVTESADANAQH